MRRREYAKSWLSDIFAVYRKTGLTNLVRIAYFSWHIYFSRDSV